MLIVYTIAFNMLMAYKISNFIFNEYFIMEDALQWRRLVRLVKSTCILLNDVLLQLIPCTIVCKNMKSNKHRHISIIYQYSCCKATCFIFINIYFQYILILRVTLCVYFVHVLRTDLLICNKCAWTLLSSLSLLLLFFSLYFEFVYINITKPSDQKDTI